MSFSYIFDILPKSSISWFCCSFNVVSYSTKVTWFMFSCVSMSSIVLANSVCFLSISSTTTLMVFYFTISAWCLASSRASFAAYAAACLASYAIYAADCLVISLPYALSFDAENVIITRTISFSKSMYSTGSYPFNTSFENGVFSLQNIKLIPLHACSVSIFKGYVFDIQLTLPLSKLQGPLIMRYSSNPLDTVVGSLNYMLYMFSWRYFSNHILRTP